MLKDEVEKKKYKCKKHEKKKPKLTRLTHKTRDSGHKTKITL
jgi:hypothetical protein